MTSTTASILGLLFTALSILVFFGFLFWMENKPNRYKHFMRIIIALIVITYTWIQFESENIFYSILVTVFAIYVIRNEYSLLLKS
jgi:hypothetical protein